MHPAPLLPVYLASTIRICSPLHGTELMVMCPQSSHMSGHELQVLQGLQIFMASCIGLQVRVSKWLKELEKGFYGACESYEKARH